MISYKTVKKKCVEERFFPYDDWRDRIFVPPSIFLTWLFVNAGISANIVSLISGLFAVLGGIMITSENNYIALVGSFGYMIYYLLDYVDGGVARFNGNIGVGGQYVDWIMHVVSSVSVFTGIFIVAFNIEGNWIVPFGILTLVSVSLSLGKYSFAWFSISMYYQQQKEKLYPNKPKPIKINSIDSPRNSILNFLKKFTTLLFHENYVIFYLPILTFFTLFTPFSLIDFRVIIIIIGGLIYFPIIISDIFRISRNDNIDKSYNEIFFENKKPNLPKDHFIE
jgi:hypothetical protein